MASQPSEPTVFRVRTVGLPAFQLRKGEDGISVFDPDAVSPPLAEQEVLDCFRPGSEMVERTLEEIQSRGLVLAVVEGADVLPARLQAAHREIRPGPTMTRSQFKAALRDLE